MEYVVLIAELISCDLITLKPVHRAAALSPGIRSFSCFSWNMCITMKSSVPVLAFKPINRKLWFPIIVCQCLCVI